MSRVLHLGVLVAALFGSSVARAAGRRSAGPQAVARLQGTNVWPAGRQPAPTFAGRDQLGRLITRSSLRGRVWAVTFLDSHCTQECSVEARALAQVEHQLGPRYPLKIVIVSVQPGYDTRKTVAKFVHESGLAGDWHWILGTRRQLEPIWRAYGIWVRSSLQHTSALYLVDKHGDIRVADAVPFVDSQLASSVRALESPTR